MLAACGAVPSWRATSSRREHFHLCRGRDWRTLHASRAQGHPNAARRRGARRRGLRRPSTHTAHVIAVCTRGRASACARCESLTAPGAPPARGSTPRASDCWGRRRDTSAHVRPGPHEKLPGHKLRSASGQSPVVSLRGHRKAPPAQPSAVWCGRHRRSRSRPQRAVREVSLASEACDCLAHAWQLLMCQTALCAFKEPNT